MFKKHPIIRLFIHPLPTFWVPCRFLLYDMRHVLTCFVPGITRFCWWICLYKICLGRTLTVSFFKFRLKNRIILLICNCSALFHHRQMSDLILNICHDTGNVIGQYIVKCIIKFLSFFVIILNMVLSIFVIKKHN